MRPSFLSSAKAAGALGCWLLVLSCNNAAEEKVQVNTASAGFPDEIVQFTAFEGNPVFTGAGKDAWDEEIRERGFILKESDGYHLWYTGYRKDKPDTLFLGYASSNDGIHWQRYPGNPVYKNAWTEDMMVIKDSNVYYMFAEGRGDTAHMLSSLDKIHWTEHGPLKILTAKGGPLSPGPYGTPTVVKTDTSWYLFYERNDSAIWLASSKDLETWKNVRDEPILKKGPDAYDRFGVAMNQVLFYKGNYYGYYHGTAFADWSEWSTNVAVSSDLIHWTKYQGNPILKENKSSGILVDDGNQYRLYSMHPQVCLHFPARTPPGSIKK